MPIETEQAIITETYNFYGAQRYNTSGVHPSERVDEGVDFSIPVTKAVLEIDGDESSYIVGYTRESRDTRYRLLAKHAEHLFSIWPDQESIIVYERGQKYGYTTYHRASFPLLAKTPNQDTDTD